MKMIVQHIKSIMLISGVITCSMVLALINPHAGLMQTFGASIMGPETGAIAEIVVRNWGALITLIGIILIYGAFQPLHRRFILVLASVSKTVFVALVLSFGQAFLAKAWIAVVFDLTVIVLYVLYLLQTQASTQQASA